MSSVTIWLGAWVIYRDTYLINHVCTEILTKPFMSETNSVGHDKTSCSVEFDLGILAQAKIKLEYLNNLSYLKMKILLTDVSKLILDEQY